MSVADITAVWEDFYGTTEETLVLLAIADSAGADGIATLDPVKIAKKCRITPDQACEILGRLRAAAWLKDEGLEGDCGQSFRLTPVVRSVTTKAGRP